VNIVAGRIVPTACLRLCPCRCTECSYYGQFLLTNGFSIQLQFYSAFKSILML